MKKKKPDLTEKQERFIQEYIVHQNGRRAAIAAGYAETNAQVESSRLLTHPKVRDIIRTHLDKRLEKRGITVARVIGRLDDMAGFDPLELIDPDTNKMKPLAEIPLEIRRCIKDISVKEEITDGVVVAETTKITFHDRIKANELLGRYLHMFNDKLEVEHKHTLESLVTGQGEREVIESTKLIEEAGDDDR